MIDLRMEARHRRRFEPSDVVQDALVEATRRFGEWCEQDRYPFQVWLRLLTAQALARAQRRHLQTQKRDAAREAELGLGRTSVSAARAADWFASTQTSPTQAARRAEVRQRVIAALAELDDMDREILALRHFEQLSNEEAAAELGIEPAAASKRFARALQRMRPVLRDLQSGDESRP
jgi:RNA polymerase sigma-70 factor (ECF subfamily)